MCKELPHVQVKSMHAIVRPCKVCFKHEFNCSRRLWGVAAQYTPPGTPPVVPGQAQQQGNPLSFMAKPRQTAQPYMPPADTSFQGTSQGVLPA